MSIEALLEAAKYLENRSHEAAIAEESIEYASYNHGPTHRTAHPSTSLIPNSLLRLEDIQEKRRGSSSDTREVHNKLEKYRRAHLKDCFETLRKQLPSVDDKKSSNLNILKAAIRCIQSLKRQEREYEHEMERLAREKIAAQQKLAALKRELAVQYPPDHDSNTSTASEGGDNEDQETLSASSPVSQREQQFDEGEEEKPKPCSLQVAVANNKGEGSGVVAPCNCTSLVLLPAQFPITTLPHQACVSSPTKSKCCASPIATSVENHTTPIKVETSGSVPNLGFSLGSRSMLSASGPTFLTPQNPRPVVGAVTVFSSMRPSSSPLHVIATSVPTLTTVRPTPSPIHVLASTTLSAPIKLLTSTASTSPAKIITHPSPISPARMINSNSAGPINLSKDGKESMHTSNVMSVIGAQANGTVGVMTPVTPLVTQMGVPVIAPAQLSKVVGISGLGYSLASPVTSGLVKPLVVVSSNSLSTPQITELKNHKAKSTTQS